MFKRRNEDIRVILDRDPAATGALQVALLYPGYRAVRMHRRAQWLLRHHMPFLARMVSQRAARKTGIEIHPGATLGRRLFIDHGTGVVIGETAVVGDDCTIYQGVTLGGTGKHVGKRHPTVGNGVMIGAGAKLLGPITIGDGARIAAGAVVINDIPANCTAVGVPARVVRIGGRRVEELDQTGITDPVAQQICILQQRVGELEKTINALKEEQSGTQGICG